MSLKCSVLKSGLCEITQGFGGSDNHRGLDLVGANYTLDDIVSYANGTVSMVTNGYGNGHGEGVNWAYGNFVKILNDDGTVCLYAHMEYTSVAVGQRVSKGQVIGRMGNSGNSFGAHLHWELWSCNDYYKNIDPSPYLSPKEIKLPSPVVRDKNKRQFQVDYNDNLRIRTEPNLSGEVVGVLNAGIYNFTEEKENDGFRWAKVSDNMWCACTDMSRILEIEPVLEEKEEDNINIPEDAKTIEIEQLKQEIEHLKKLNIELEDKLNLKNKEEYNYFKCDKSGYYYIKLEENEVLKYNIN